MYTMQDITSIVSLSLANQIDLVKELIRAGGRAPSGDAAAVDSQLNGFARKITEVRPLSYEGFLSGATAGNRDLVSSNAWVTGDSLKFSFTRGALGQYAAGTPHTGNVFIATHAALMVGPVVAGTTPTALAYQLATAQGIMCTQDYPSNTTRLANANIPLSDFLKASGGQQGVPSDAVFQTANVARGLELFGNYELFQLPFPIVLEPQALWNITLNTLLGTPTSCSLGVHPKVFGLDIGGPTNLNM